MLSLQSSEMERYGRDFGIAEASLPLNQPDAIRGEALLHIDRLTPRYAGRERIRGSRETEGYLLTYCSRCRSVGRRNGRIWH